MTFKEIHNKAGPLSGYVGYIVILFVWYFFFNAYSTMLPGLSNTPIYTILDWGLYLLIFPLVNAGVFGGIHEQQRTPDVLGGNRFFAGVKSHFLRFVGAYLLITIFHFFSYFLLTFLLSLAFGGETSEKNSQLLIAIIDIPINALFVFWLSAIVVERKIFRGLLHAIKTILYNPKALTIGILWAAIIITDVVVFDIQSEQIPLAINGIRSGVFAICKVLATMYALAIFKMVWGDKLAGSSDEQIADSPEKTTPGDNLVKAGFGFAFVSFIPLLHLPALVLGILGLRQKKRFDLRSAFACCVGGFFTVFYLLVAAAWLLGRPSASDVSLSFLTEIEPDLEPYVSLLANGELEGFSQQLESDYPKDSERSWVIDFTSALAKHDDSDLEGALKDFYIAAEKNPDRSEFYYYYGLALLENEQEELAVEQFKTALVQEPKLEIAQQYITLLETAYEPPVLISSLLLLITLHILFTLHEYGHAFTAWKLGDDTAKNQGRLTLNPVPHLDLFGSILLPGILLFQQAGVIFGWAKPVPVNPENFKDPIKDHMRVSFAGPAVNLIVSMVCVILLGFIFLFVRILWPEALTLNLSGPYGAVSMVGPPFARWIVFIIVFLKQLFFTSIILGFFNLIPIPPLDGAWIFAGFLPQQLRDFLEQQRRFSLIFFLVLVVTPALDYFLAIPMMIAWGMLDILVSVMGLA